MTEPWRLSERWPTTSGRSQARTGARRSQTSPESHRERGSTMENETHPGSPPLCPSAQPQMEGSTIIGVVGGTPESPATRLSRGASSGHGTGSCPLLAGPTDCGFPSWIRPLSRGMAASILTVLIADSPGGSSSCYPRSWMVCPRVIFGRMARWWRQEGKVACLRCPQVVTDASYPSELYRQVADPNTSTDLPSHGPSAVPTARDLA